MASLAEFPMFKCEPKHNASTRWQRWVDRFDNFLVAMGIEKEARKKALLLHYCGNCMLFSQL